MEKARILESIESAAQRRGFSVKYSARSWLPDIISERMNFTLLQISDMKTDWSDDKARINITVSARVEKADGNLTADELRQAEDEIRRGEELLRELQGMELFYIVTF